MFDMIGAIQSVFQGTPQENAAKTQASSQLTAEQLQWQEFQSQMNQPMNLALQKQGPTAINALMARYGANQPQFGMQDFQNSPAYQSMMGANQLLMQNAPAQYAASGMLGSGNMQSGLQNAAQQNAMTSEGNSYQQWLGQQQLGMNALQSTAGLSQSQGLGMAGIGQNTAYNMGQNIVGAGNALAAGQLGQSNAWSNGIGNIGSGGLNAFNQAMNYYNQQNSMNGVNSMDTQTPNAGGIWDYQQGSMAYSGAELL
jgi:hypothetical protein